MSQHDQEEQHVSGPEAMRQVTQMIRGIKFAMFTTVGEGGALSSRPMTTQEQEFDGDLWFIGNRDAEVCQDIAAHAQVNVAYAQPEEGEYVSLSGQAELVEDRAKLEKLWSDDYDRYFDGGIDDPQVQLIRVDAERAEYWGAESRTLYRRGERGGERGSVDL